MPMSRRGVLVVILTVLGCLLATASPALAASTAQSPFPVRACNLEVCETIIAIPPPQLEVNGTAMPVSFRCGTFVMTVTTVRGTQVERSPRICSVHPSFTFMVRTFGVVPPGSTIAMEFQSTPPTPGRPVIRI